ncbi:MAG: ABC transporter substrate-binding protein [Lachnospiraceae bacterium]
MKRKVALLMACAMTAAAVAGCGSSSGSSDTGAGAGTTAAGTAAEGGAASSGGDIKLTMSWWGNQIRNESTQAALDLYSEQNAGVTIDGQFSEWSDYWNKLATSAAGKAIPDLVQMDYMYLDQYVKSDLLVDLTPYIEDGTLDISNISENTMASGTVDGGVYAICAGINSPALLYNKTLLDENGITVKDNMTLDEFYDVCRQVYEKTGVKTNIAYGIGESYSNFFVRSFDTSQFVDGKMGGSAETYVPFFEQYTKGLAEGWLIDPGVFAELALGSVEQEPLVYGSAPATQSWCAFYNSNQLAAMQKAAPEGMEIGITTWPAVDPLKSNFLKSGQFFSVGAHTKNPEEAVKVLNFLINSMEANDILLGERGVPAASDVAEAIAPKMSEEDQKVVAFINNVVTPNCSPIDPPQPEGASEVYNLLQQMVEKVCYGELDAQAAAEQFFDSASKIMDSKQ